MMEKERTYKNSFCSVILMNFIRGSKMNIRTSRLSLLIKFFTVRPNQCILAGDSGTHMVCVCIYHKNVKLMLNGDIANLTPGTAMQLSYKDCLRTMMCPNPTLSCHLTTTKTPPNEGRNSSPGLSAI